MRRVGHKGADHIAPGQHPGQLRRRARRGRRHDRVRRPPRAPGRQRPPAPRPRLRGLRAAPPLTLEEGLDHLAAEPSPASSSTSTSRSRAMSCACSTPCATPAWSSARWSARPVPRRASPRLRAPRPASPGLVGPAAAPGLHRRHPVHRVPALAVLSAVPRLPCRAGGRGAARAAMRRADGPLAPRHAPARARGRARRRRAVRVDGRRRPRIAALEALGVSGVITNDPRLFG